MAIKSIFTNLVDLPLSIVTLSLVLNEVYDKSEVKRFVTTVPEDVFREMVKIKRTMGHETMPETARELIRLAISRDPQWATLASARWDAYNATARAVHIRFSQLLTQLHREFFEGVEEGK